jgi:hypothetical protein
MPAGWTLPGNESTAMISNPPLLEPRRARLVSVCLAGIVSLCLLVVQAAAQTGQVAGKVVEDRTGTPLSYTNVAVVGTNLGAITAADGSFKINGIPLGRQTIQASYLGYQTERTEVVVTSGVTARVDFRMKETVAKKEKASPPSPPWTASSNSSPG